jgi:tetratricopeptide (TPR) repeat protein
MDLCPDDMEACMKLLMVYEKANKKSQFNKLLEKLSLLFPDDKNILIRAGLDCINRKAFSKGVKFLERARELDSLDGTIKNHLGYAYLLEALNFFDKGKIAKGRSVYESALKNGLDNSDDLNRGKAYIYTRWAGKEFILSNEDEGREKMALAWSKAKDHFSLLYFTFLIFKSYGVLEVYIQKPAREMEEELQKTPTSQRAVFLLKIYSYMAMADISKTPWLELERKRALNYALKAAKGPCSRDDAMFIVSFSIREEAGYNLAKKYIKKMLSEDRQDPCFLYLNFKIKKRERFGRPVRGEMEELKNILLLAEKRNDKNTAQSVRKEIADMEQGFGLGDIFNQPFPFGDFVEDEDEDEGEDDFNIIESLINEFFSIGGRGRKKGKKRR